MTDPVTVGNVTFHDPLPGLEDCLVRVARMIAAFEQPTSDDLRDIRSADVMALVGDLRFRASVFEKYHREREADKNRMDWIEANCRVETHQPLLQWPNMNGNDLRSDIDSARDSEAK